MTAAEFKDLERRLMRAPAEAVAQALGQPNSTHRCNGVWRWSYSLGRGTTQGLLVVAIEGGRVVGLGHNERQTGVREDDFVGLVGP